MPEVQALAPDHQLRPGGPLLIHPPPTIRLPPGELQAAQLNTLQLPTSQGPLLSSAINLPPGEHQAARLDPLQLPPSRAQLLSPLASPARVPILCPQVSPARLCA